MTLEKVFVDSNIFRCDNLFARLDFIDIINIYNCCLLYTSRCVSTVCPINLIAS
ncbi:hypothetical protein A5876_002788, partial [Enterococcus sp. 3C8_DIV0646]